MGLQPPGRPCSPPGWHATVPPTSPKWRLRRAMEAPFRWSGGSLAPPRRAGGFWGRQPPGARRKRLQTALRRLTR
eukprot:12048050-Alexandrium_andersonii.AAC.1